MPRRQQESPTRGKYEQFNALAMLTWRPQRHCAAGPQAAGKLLAASVPRN